MKVKANATIKQAIKSYKNGPPPSKGSGEWALNPSFEATRKVLGSSFAGTPTVSGDPEFDWILSHVLEEENEWYTPEEHRKTVSFMLGFHIYYLLQKRPLIVSRRVAGSQNEELASAAIVIEYNKKREVRKISRFFENWCHFVAFWKLTISGGLPQLLSNNKHEKHAKCFERKGDKFDVAMRKSHQEEGPEDVHWYVAIVGVGPEHNGKGYGGELMNKINDLADEAGISCYLECGTRNKPFYEKFGYKERDRHTITDPVNPETPPYDFFIMVRNPRSGSIG